MTLPNVKKLPPGFYQEKLTILFFIIVFIANLDILVTITKITWILPRETSIPNLRIVGRSKILTTACRG